MPWASAAPTSDAALAPERVYAGARGADLARVVRGAFLRVESNDEACARIEAPCLLLVGAEDRGWIGPTRKLAEQVPGARLVVLEDAGHLVHLERPADCADAIAALM